MNSPPKIGHQVELISEREWVARLNYQIERNRARGILFKQEQGSILDNLRKHSTASKPAIRTAEICRDVVIADG